MKHKIIFYLMLFFFASSFNSMKAEGLYKKAETETVDAGKGDSKALKGPPKDGGEEPDYGSVSDGMIIFSLLAGGYLLYRFKNKGYRKHEV